LVADAAQKWMPPLDSDNHVKISVPVNFHRIESILHLARLLLRVREKQGGVGGAVPLAAAHERLRLAAIVAVEVDTATVVRRQHARGSGVQRPLCRTTLWNVRSGCLIHEGRGAKKGMELLYAEVDPLPWSGSSGSGIRQTTKAAKTKMQNAHCRRERGHAPPPQPHQCTCNWSPRPAAWPCDEQRAGAQQLCGGWR